MSTRFLLLAVLLPFAARAEFRAGFAERAGDQMRAAGLELARQLQPIPLPQRPPAPPFKGEGWSYGNQPSQVR